MYVTCYICQVGALSKAEDILEWNMGLVLTYVRILFQRNETRCVKNEIKGRQTSLRLRTCEV